jgi:hypothetical protein
VETSGSKAPLPLGLKISDEFIPRPSRYYGRRHDLVTRDRANLRKLGVQASADPSFVPSAPEPFPARIDKSALTLANETSP